MYNHCQLSYAIIIIITIVNEYRQFLNCVNIKDLLLFMILPQTKTPYCIEYYTIPTINIICCYGNKNHYNYLQNMHI